MFNRLEFIATQRFPRTPVLGSRITSALEPDAVEEDVGGPIHYKFNIPAENVLKFDSAAGSIFSISSDLFTDITEVFNTLLVFTQPN